MGDDNALASHYGRVLASSRKRAVHETYSLCIG
jgi:hypothetical protein